MALRLARERARDETWARTLDYDEVSYVAHEVTAEISGRHRGAGRSVT
ncbi:hypothetical protein ACFPQB_01655 [Nocardioides vastitatis]|uniref:Uncharacterized protein n=1 Tax=Nocardioides vastitatis TaxID=2568655 RepID=A0ABW0ZGF5_9ACTN